MSVEKAFEPNYVCIHAEEREFTVIHNDLIDGYQECQNGPSVSLCAYTGCWCGCSKPNTNLREQNINLHH